MVKIGLSFVRGVLGLGLFFFSFPLNGIQNFTESERREGKLEKLLLTWFYLILA